MRLLTGPVQIGRPRPQAGGANLSVIRRDRKGFAPFFTVGDASIQRVVGQRIFTPDELYRIYQICPDVRAPIDKISLRLANTPWLIQPNVKRDDPRYGRALELAKVATAFLSKPNTDDPWTTFAQKWAQDTLIYDAHAVERVRDARGKLQELVVWRGGDITPLVDEHGRRYSYRQDAAIRGPTTFLPEDLDYGNLFANTQYPNGQPIIETLVEEFITMRAQAQHLRRLVDADEIPPGILALVGVGEIARRRFEAEMQAQQGRDDLLRIVNIEDPGGKIDWLQLHRSLKDLDWLPNVREVRKTIWRLFHVTPVTMGETDAVPRASAEVQVEIADQGLIGPMMHQLDRDVNTSWLPLILGPADAELVWFGFDTTPALSQQDQKVRAERLSALVSAQILTVNEAREELGYDAADGGDEVVEADGEDASADPVQESDPRPGRFRTRLVRRTRAGIEVRGDLPSDWQPAGRFKDVRTLPLTRLGGLVREYDDVVTPLYERCAREVLRAATDAVSDGVLTSSEATVIAGAIGRETTLLIDDWSKGTTDLYDRAAELGADTAVEWGGSQVAWRSLAATYQASAISYLTTSGAKSVGLVTALRRELTDLVLATMSRSEALVRWSEQARERAAKGEQQNRAGEKLPAALGAFLEAVRRVFERHQHRISNWSGRLVELAHIVTGESLRAPVTFPASDPDEPATTEDRWLVEWVEVSDDATCPTCRSEGMKDFRPVTELTTMPGGATECGARCRCVLVYWLESEVKSGKAKRLGPIRSRLGRVRVTAPV